MQPTEKQLKEAVTREAYKIFFRKSVDEKYSPILTEIKRIKDFYSNFDLSVSFDGFGKDPFFIEFIKKTKEISFQTAKILDEVLLNFIQTNQLPDKPAMKEMENTIRRFFVLPGHVIDKILDNKKQIIPKPNNKIKIPDINSLVPAGILPTKEELGYGERQKKIFELMDNKPEYKNVLKYFELLFTHVLRIIYRLHDKDIGIIRKPNDLIPHRTAVDLKMRQEHKR